MARLFLLAASCLVCVAQSKRLYGSFELNNAMPYAVIGKNSFSVGEGRLEGNLTSTTDMDIQMHLFLDEDWDKFKLTHKLLGSQAGQLKAKDPDSHDEISLCEHLMKGAKTEAALTKHHSVGHDAVQKYTPQAWVDTKVASDQWHMYDYSTRITQSQRAHTWYLVAAQCGEMQVKRQKNPPKFYYSVDFLTQEIGDRRYKEGEVNWTHLPEEEKGLPEALWYIFLALVVFGGIFGYMCQRKVAEQGTIHMVLILLGMALCLQMVFIFCQLWHLGKYAEDGLGYRWQHSWLALDVVGELSQSMSQLITSGVFMSLACGWTLTCGSIEYGEETRWPTGTIMWYLDNICTEIMVKLRRPSELCVPITNKASVLFLSLVALHIVLAFAAFSGETEFDQFHNHECWSGLLLLVTRIGLYAIFCTALYRLQGSVESSSQIIMVLLGLLGTVYFLGYPILVVVSYVIAEYWRHRVVTAGCLGLQSLSLLMLSFLFLGSNPYTKKSTLGGGNDVVLGGMLPGAGMGGASHRRRSSWGEKVAVD